MKTHEKRTLETILKHKEYFDSRLIEISSTAQSIILELRNTIEVLKEENKSLSTSLKSAQLRLISNEKELERIRNFSKKKSDENEELREYLKSLEEKLKKEEKENEEYKKQIEELIKRNNELYEKIERKIKRMESSNSTNSNMPTSFDVLSHTVSKANANTRKKTGLKRGGQKGHALHKSRLSENIDEIIIMNVDKAPNGAIKSTDENGKTYYATQEIDLVLKNKITETRYYVVEDGVRLDESYMEKYAVNSVTYAPHFKATVVYLNQKGTIPYQRLCEMINEISNGEITIWPSTIVKWNNEVHENSLSVRKEILSSILEKELVHVDETGMKINGRIDWMHTLTNENGSYFVRTKSRGDKECGPLYLLREYEGIVMHDHFKSYQNLQKCNHAECNAHIDRYLKCGIEVDNNEECKEMLELLHKMLSKKTELIEKGIYKIEDDELTKFEERYLEIANRGLKKYYETHKIYEKKYEPEYIPTFKRMIEFKEDHLRFIKDFRVPYTNNAAERQCRIVKNKKKISGQFVSAAGAEAYADTLTIMQTSKIRKQNTLTNLENIFS